MIQNIVIKSIATYDDINGVCIDGLKKVNFIYGANGSGKTTMSNFLQQPEDEKFSDCSVVWKDGVHLATLVYNKEFREQTFGRGSIPGVFTLGKATKEEIAEINGLQEQLVKIKNDKIEKEKYIDKQNKEIEKLLKDFEDKCWVEIYKNNEQLFKESFKGFMGSKKTFSEKVISEFNSNNSDLKKIEELKEKAKVVFGEEPQIINEIKFIDFSGLISIENNDIWERKIVGKQDVEIGGFIQRLNINDWVNQGRYFLVDDSEVCPFCQKGTIDNDFRKQLEDYFDETYTSNLKKIKELYEDYICRSENIVHFFEKIENIESETKDTKLNNELFSSCIRTLNQQFTNNKEILNNKLKEPSRSLGLISVKEQLIIIEKLILDANIEIGKHNSLVENFQTEKSVLIADVWRFLLDENKEIIDAYLKKSNGLKKGIVSLGKEVEKLGNSSKIIEAQIIEKNKNITSIQAAIDEINKTLESYGFDNFKIIPFDDRYYKIQRENGDDAESTLSEGEITFITFLYFLQLAKGGLSPENANEERVLIVDDPISSLDSTILFVVSSLLKEMIKSVKRGNSNIKQIIILTHNVYFHKEVSYVDRSDKNRDDVRYWIIRKSRNITNIECFEKKNPIRGSYELLWDEVKSKNILSGITLQNTLRRILETYFKTMGAYTDENLLDSFENSQEKEICRSLMCWINDGSHCISDDLHVERQEVHNNIFSDVFKKLFEKMGHIGHYNMMMDINSDEAS